MLVFGPKFVEYGIGQVPFHIVNQTVYGVPQSDPYNGWVHNAFKFHNPMFVGAKIHETNVSMIINMPKAPSSWSGFSNGSLGWFTMPETKMKPGDNWVQFDAAIHFNSTADHGFRMEFFQMWELLSGVAYVDVVAEPELTLFGLFTVKTTFKRSLACNCLNGTDWCQPRKPKPSPDKIPSDFWKEDDLYLEPHRDDATHEPSTGPFDDILPVIEVFCEPSDVDVSGGGDGPSEGPFIDDDAAALIYS